MGPLDDYLVDYMPYHYGRTEFTLPSLGDPQGNLTGNQEIYIFVDLGQWLDAGSPYTPPPAGIDPNMVYYNFSLGRSTALPGYTVMRVESGMDVEQLITFDPDADPAGYPFMVTRPDLLFNGTLRLLSDETFTSEEYNGNLTAGDSDWSGNVDNYDFARMAEQWLHTGDTIGPSLP